MSVLYIGNPAEINPNYMVSTDDECAPCTNSNLTLKEQIMSLNNMVLVEGKESETPPTNDDESLA